MSEKEPGQMARQAWSECIRPDGVMKFVFDYDAAWAVVESTIREDATERLADKLTDPSAVRVNILRGVIVFGRGS